MQFVYSLGPMKKCALLVKLLPLGAFLGVLQPTEAHAIWDAYAPVNTCEYNESVQLRLRGPIPSGFGSVVYNHGSGVYMGKGIVVTAAHVVSGMRGLDGSGENGCGTYGTPWCHEGGDPDAFGAEIDFGEVEDGEVVTIPANCYVHPGFEFVGSGGLGGSLGNTNVSGPDIAYCKLLDQAPEVGYFGNAAFNTGAVPLSMAPTGCERDYLYQSLYGQYEDPVMAEFVGSGCEDQPADGPQCGWVGSPYDGASDNYGTTRHVQGRFEKQVYFASVSADVLTTWQPAPFDADDWEGPIRVGDSGSPMYVTMEDGSQRLVGLASFLYTGTGKMAYVPLPSHLRWLENATGKDFTPCYDFVSGEGYVFEDGTDCLLAFHGAAAPANATWDNACQPNQDTERTPTSMCGGWNPITDKAPPNPESSLDIALWLVTEPVEVEALFSNPTVDPLPGTTFRDVLVGDPADKAIVYAGGGDDLILTGRDGDHIFGGRGDDWIATTGGDDLIHPGRGRDIVVAGKGDDVVFIMNGCEVERGDYFHGGTGRDTLITPVGLRSLKAAGVVVRGFERVIVTDKLGPADCSRVGEGIVVEPSLLAPPSPTAPE